tara:strand:+ start:10794 stop:11180 length:387 start_codon:yes stop_codon:yes gene_type:complete
MAADLFHLGHLNLIKRAREQGDYLIVGVHSDADIASYKRVPIINESQRYELVRACRYVDEVIEAAPLIMTEQFLGENKIDYVVRGDDITPELLRQQAVPIKMGIMKYVPRTKHVSTTAIIERIKEDYE